MTPDHKSQIASAVLPEVAKQVGEAVREVMARRAEDRERERQRWEELRRKAREGEWP